jgi:hypothetical protein
VTWFVWQGTWFGARLDDDALIAAMAPDAKPRDVQHGIEEITRRFDERAVGMERWSKALVDASRRAEDPVRVVAAWAMQSDPGREEFVVRLREMVAADESVLVRRNAACSLAKSGDAAGRAVLRSMLEPFTVTAPCAGTVGGLAAVDVPARELKPVGRVRRDDGSDVLVIAAVPGRVTKRVAADGARVAAGEAVIVLAPDSRHALNAALALALVGTKEDVEVLELAAAPQSAFDADAKSAARAAADAVRARSR